MENKPGLYAGTTFAEYVEVDAANQSVIKKHKKSAAHARVAMLAGSKETKALRQGHIIHTIVLEPDTFDDLYVVPPKCDRRTKLGKETWNQFAEQNPGKDLIEAGEHDMFRAVNRRIHDHTIAGELLAGAIHKEVTLIWIDPVTEMLCKARIDLISKFRGWVVLADLKTTRDASPKGFPREAHTYDYAFQAAWYLDGMTALAEHERRFMFIAVEKEEPFACGVFEPDLAMIDSGRRDYRRCMLQHMECKTTNEWPAYGDDAVHTLALQDWQLSEVTYDDDDGSDNPTED